VSLTALVLLTNLLLSVVTASIASFAANQRFGLFFLLPLPIWLELLLGIVSLDLFAYFAHVLLHKSWITWQFHRVHHSDIEVNVTTAFRQHPGETFWRVLWQTLAVALFGIPLWIVVIYLMISAMNAQLEHANIQFNKSLDGYIRLVFVTPNMHKIHHSREQQQTDTNYSNIFSFWDRIFGTYTALADFSRLRYGLNGFDDARKQTLAALLKNPFLADL
jgi:sterol desaturase/sphingolipid hydroxylase (fatty acid hydroxylase superfamily)